MGLYLADRSLSRAIQVMISRRHERGCTMGLSSSASIREHGQRAFQDRLEMMKEQDNASPSDLGIVHESMKATKIN
jgi:hypothetical protein